MGKRIFEADDASSPQMQCVVLGQQKRLRTSAEYRAPCAAPGVAMECVTPSQYLPGLQVQPAAVPETAWQCFNELNSIVQCRNPSFSDVVLRSYHSFTRATKPVVFARLAQASTGGQPLSSLQQLPWHLQMVSYVLDNLFPLYEQATICSYTFSPPDWLQAWCLKWGFGSGTTVTILGVTCHSEPPPSSCSAKFHSFGSTLPLEQQAPARTIYVPTANS